MVTDTSTSSHEGSLTGPSPQTRAKNRRPRRPAGPQTSTPDPRVSRLAGPARSAQRRTLGGLTPAPVGAAVLYGWVANLYSWVESTCTIHQTRASRWSALDGWMRLATAVVASLSALTLFTESTTITAIFAVTTALGAGLTAAWAPEKRAREHRRAYKAYVAQLRPIGDLELALRSRMGSTAYDSDSGMYYDTGDVPLPDAEFAAFWRQYQSNEVAIDAVTEDAPLLNRFFSGNPRTKLGLRRLRRQIELERQVDALYEYVPTEETRDEPKPSKSRLRRRAQQESPHPVNDLERFCTETRRRLDDAGIEASVTIRTLPDAVNVNLVTPDGFADSALLAEAAAALDDVPAVISFSAPPVPASTTDGVTSRTEPPHVSSRGVR